MADELYLASTYVGNITAATAMRMFALKMGHRDVSFLAHPTVQSQWEDMSGLVAALTEELPILGLGLDKLTSRTEGQAAPNVQPSSTTVTPSTARYSAQFKISGLSRKRGLQGAVAVATFIDALVKGGQITLMSAIASAASGLSKNAGATGVAVGVTGFKSLCDQIRRSGQITPGVLVALLHPYTWEGITNDGLGLGGAFQMSPEAQRMIGGVYGGSYQGRFLDGTVDVFTSDQVPTMNAGADYRNQVFAPGCYAIRTEPPPEAIAADVIAQAGWIRIEADRDAAGDDDMVIAHAYQGVTVAQADAGGYLISKVP